MLCVPWIDHTTTDPTTKKPKVSWCALLRAHQDPKAAADPTKCGYVIMCRTGLEDMEEPTCKDCRKVLGLDAPPKRRKSDTVPHGPECPCGPCEERWTH